MRAARAGTAASDRERLRDTEHVLHGPGGSGAWRQLLYVVYVIALLSGLYGFTILRGVVATYGSRWRAAHLLGPLAAGGFALLVVLVLLAHAAGRRRGPVTPELGWVDHVVSSAIDRRLTLREAWLVPLTALTAAGAVLGGVVGSALWGGGVLGPVAAVAGLLSGLAAGVVVALVWLAGQLASDPAAGSSSGARGLRLALRPRSALAHLGIEGLRAHSGRSARLGGAVLAGDPRALRLEAASPVRRGRGIRLRSRGPKGTVVARDLLGLRRQPLLVVGGLALVAPGTAGLAWASTSAGVPLVVATVAVVLTHLGASLWGEGIRLFGDTLGAPRLLGGSLRGEAAAHSAVPVALTLAAGTPVAAATCLALDTPLLAGTVAVIVVTAVTTGCQWVGGFRVQLPAVAALPEAGPAVLLLWWAWPVVLAAAVGTFVLARLEAVVRGGSLAPALVAGAGALSVLGWRAAAALRRASEASRG